jgi:methanethiol S-methyltransferase
MYRAFSRGRSKLKDMTGRILTFVYGAASYAVFFGTFLYAIGFLGNFGVPKTLDSAPDGPWQTALAIDLGLLSLFAVQHSVMARQGFKRALTRVIPATLERSTYVLASSLALLFLFWQWRPLGGTIWEVENEAGKAALYGGFAFGWALVLFTTFVINHFDLFGLRQVWRHLLGRPQTKIRFVTPLLYRIVRHPLYVGWLFTFWSTPSMTATHLLFALMTTAYILAAIQLEERDLMREHPEYAEYRKQVPMLIPRLHRPEAIAAPAAARLGKTA